MTEIPKMGHYLKILSPFLSKYLPPGAQEKAWGQICPPPWVLKGPKSAGFYRVKEILVVEPFWYQSLALSFSFFLFSCPSSTPVRRLTARVMKNFHFLEPHSFFTWSSFFPVPFLFLNIWITKSDKPNAIGLLQNNSAAWSMTLHSPHREKVSPAGVPSNPRDTRVERFFIIVATTNHQNATPHQREAVALPSELSFRLVRDVTVFWWRAREQLDAWI